ncbi:MAG: hypothetical protein EOP24_39105 [Hyphomicrobiales bacterium]|nr:MAG: hypothetical protein EOP24_39105 [Hyphomicrobiales bacterium]
MLGFCEHQTRTIFIAKGLRQRQRRAVLVHELTHLDRGPVADCDHLAGKEEATVERMASERMIELDALVHALLWSQDEHELAEELWCDVATVRDRIASLTFHERAWVEAEIDRREATLP